MSTETKSLAEALAVLMTKLPEIRKDQTAKVKTDKANYSYNYADLARVSRALLPILGDLGLSFTSAPTLADDGRFVLAYELLHVSGESKPGKYPLPTSGTPQSMGSAITYARRYCLCAVTGVAPEDDDDGAAAEAEARRPAAEPQWERPPREPQTDPEWLTRMETELNNATSAPELETVANTIRAAENAGKVSQVHGEHLLHIYQQKQGELAGKGTS